MRFVFKMIVFPFWLLTAFLALMLKWTLNLSAFVLALPMLYIFGCGLYTLYCREWLQFLILLVAEFGCFLLITAGTLSLWKPWNGSVAGLPIMDTDAMTDYSWENLHDILQRQLADDDEYRALKEKDCRRDCLESSSSAKKHGSLYLALDA